MGVFDDKEYDSLDWISQAVEPIKSPLNDILLAFPDELKLTFQVYSSFKESSYSVGLNVNDMVLVLAERAGFRLEYSLRGLLSDCFILEVEPGSEIDFERREIRGSVKLLKTKKQFDEKDLEKTLGIKGLYKLDDKLSRRAEYDLTRLNDVLDILDTNCEARHSRSSKKKVVAIKSLITKVFKENQWRIRDSNLADRFCNWVIAYIKEGSAPAYANICRLKLMTHKGVAIYSMKEDEI